MWFTPLKLFDFVPNYLFLILILIYVNSALNLFFVILRTVVIHSMIADLVGEYELSSGSRQEGAMFAGALFAGKLMIDFGYLFGGHFVDFIGLETGMTITEIPVAVSPGLVVALGPGLGAAFLFDSIYREIAPLKQTNLAMR